MSVESSDKTDRTEFAIQSHRPISPAGSGEVTPAFHNKPLIVISGNKEAYL